MGEKVSAMVQIVQPGWPRAKTVLYEQCNGFPCQLLSWAELCKSYLHHCDKQELYEMEVLAKRQYRFPT